METEDYFVKLYKDIDGNLYYWESWVDEGEYTVHLGKVGEEGESKEINDFKVLKDEENSYREKGYCEIEDLKSIIIQYKIDDMGDADDIDMRNEIEDIMNEELGWTGLGHCDGGEIRTGTINIFCMVIDVKLAFDVIIQALEENEYLEGAVIAKDGEDEFVVLYPEDYSGHFNYLYEE